MRRLMILVVLLMAPISMFAHGLGSIGGTVADPSGALVPGVRITATEVGTNLSRSAISDEQGRFVRKRFLLTSRLRLTGNSTG